MDDFEIIDGVLLKYNGTASEVIIPDYVKVIGKESFLRNYHIKTVKLPLSVSVIEESAFKDSTLEDIVIPDNVKEIGAYSFRHCRNLKCIEISESTSIGTGSFDQCESLRDKDGFIIVNDVFFGYDGKQTFIKIPDNVKRIDSCATFSNATSLIMPVGMNRLDHSQFLDNFEYINLPENIESIPDCQFMHCRKLKSMTIPSTVTSIGDKAFETCKNLETVTMYSSIKHIGVNAFCLCKKLKKITVIKNTEFYMDTIICLLNSLMFDNMNERKVGLNSNPEPHIEIENYSLTEEEKQLLIATVKEGIEVNYQIECSFDRAKEQLLKYISC